MGDLLPFAFEAAWKDSVLGSSNLHYGFYIMFKLMTHDMLYPGVASEKLVRAVHSLTDTSQRKRTSNVDAEIRRGWVRLRELQWRDQDMV
jgi:hypothetical protein